MTTVHSLSQTAVADPLVRCIHLAVLLGCTEQTLQVNIRKGRVPKADGYAGNRSLVWRLSTIRAWNPALAESVAALLSNPALAETYLPALR